MLKAKQRIKNQFNLINLIRSKEKISQADLSVLTKMQPSSISYIINNLKMKNIIKENGKKKSTKVGGKRADFLSLNPDFGFFGSIYIKNVSILFYLFDFSGKIINSYSKTISKLNREEVFKLIIPVIQVWQKEFDYKATSIVFSYIVDNKGNALFDANDQEILEFKKGLQHEFKEHTLIIENDANCSAFYSQERLQNKYNTLLNFLIYFNPFRLGCGIIINKKLYRGSFGAAGEIVGFDNSKILLNFDDKKKNIDFLNYFEEVIISRSVFLDSDALVLSGDINKMPKEFLEDFKQSLQNKLKNTVIDFSERDFPVITGAVLLVIKKYTHADLLLGMSSPIK